MPRDSAAASCCVAPIPDAPRHTSGLAASRRCPLLISSRASRPCATFTRQPSTPALTPRRSLGPNHEDARSSEDTMTAVAVEAPLEVHLEPKETPLDSPTRGLIELLRDQQERLSLANSILYYDF